MDRTVERVQSYLEMVEKHAAAHTTELLFNNLPRDYRRQLLGDTQSVAWALLSAAPDLRDWRVVGDWLAAELARA